MRLASSLLLFLGVCWKVTVVSAFTCTDGCVISNDLYDDNFCHCSDCFDEPQFSCETCGGCPTECGAFWKCPTFECSDGCDIPEYRIDDEWCDCGDCGDETAHDCDSCPGCPLHCGQSIECTGLPLTTPPPIASDKMLLATFIISQHENVNETDECLAAIKVNGSDYVSPRGFPACNSLADALHYCMHLTHTVFASVAPKWALTVDSGNQTVDGCEFLYVSWNRHTQFFEDDTSAWNPPVIQLGVYPWQYSWNALLRKTLSDSNAAEMERAKVEVTRVFLWVANLLEGAFVLLRSLQLTAANTLGDFNPFRTTSNLSN